MISNKNCKYDKYELVQTEDGSPTFRDLQGANLESMHHRAGAYSETLEIYGRLVQFCLKEGKTRFVSVGLGLGYNEILIAAEVLRIDRRAANIQLRSFEADPFLRESFLRYIASESQAGPGDDIFSVYDGILSFFVNDPYFQGLQKKQIIQSLRLWLESGQWTVEGHLHEKTDWKSPYDGILFDAFSAKTNPELWSESFLCDFFSRACSENAAVTTYACTGALKRSLKKTGFHVEKISGFSNKRNSTFARRGQWTC